MTVIDAADRFHERRDDARVLWFAESRGINPMVTFRSGGTFPLILMKVAPLLVRVIGEAERQVPAVAALVSLWWDDRTCSEATIRIDPGLLEYLGHAPPPEFVNVEIDDALIRVGFEVAPLSGEAA